MWKLKCKKIFREEPASYLAQMLFSTKLIYASDLRERGLWKKKKDFPAVVSDKDHATPIQ